MTRRRACCPRRRLAEKRKWAIVIFVVAAVLTPPDPVSQIGLAVPTIILYEISIWTAHDLTASAKRNALAAEKKAEGEAAGPDRRQSKRLVGRPIDRRPDHGCDLVFHLATAAGGEELQLLPCA